MDLVEAVNAQLKTEIDGAELNKTEKYTLQQKYGLLPMTDVEINWYLTEVGND